MPRVAPPEAFRGHDQALREALAQAIKACPLSRYEIASRISELLDRELTKDTLDKYTSEAAIAHRIHAIVLPAFCIVTGSRLPIEALAASIGCVLAGPEEAKQLELARLFQEKADLEKRIQEMKEKNGEA